MACPGCHNSHRHPPREAIWPDNFFADAELTAAPPFLPELSLRLCSAETTQIGRDLRRLPSRTTQEIAGIASSRGRDNANEDAIYADSCFEQRKKGGILRRTGEASQRGGHRRQQAGFEGGPALDAFLFGDALQDRLVAILPITGIRGQNQRHNGLFRPLSRQSPWSMAAAGARHASPPAHLRLANPPATATSHIQEVLFFFDGFELNVRVMVSSEVIFNR